MNQGGYVTLVGFVAQDPRQRQIKDGLRVTDLRVGATTRVQDRVTKEWRDADTSYYDVTCWRRLGDHVRASMHKGEPVFVKGRFKSRSYEDKNGQLKNVISIVADTVGHDLNRGPANYMRPSPPPAATEGDPAGNWPADTGETPDMTEGPSEMIDEEAVERFGRDLDEAGLAARALDEDEEARATTPF
jgi:single-strand DNA-binding protein